MTRRYRLTRCTSLVSAHPRDLLISHGWTHTSLSATNAAAKMPRPAARPMRQRLTTRRSCSLYEPMRRAADQLAHQSPRIARHSRISVQRQRPGVGAVGSHPLEPSACITGGAGVDAFLPCCIYHCLFKRLLPVWPHAPLHSAKSGLAEHRVHTELRALGSTVLVHMGCSVRGCTKLKNRAQCRP